MSRLLLLALMPIVLVLAACGQDPQPTPPPKPPASEANITIIIDGDQPQSYTIQCPGPSSWPVKDICDRLSKDPKAGELLRDITRETRDLAFITGGPTVTVKGRFAGQAFDLAFKAQGSGTRAKVYAGLRQLLGPDAIDWPQFKPRPATQPAPEAP